MRSTPVVVLRIAVQIVPLVIHWGRARARCHLDREVVVSFSFVPFRTLTDRGAIRRLMSYQLFKHIPRNSLSKRASLLRGLVRMS